MKKLLLLLAIITTTITIARGQTTVQMADTAFSHKEYAKAIELYNDALAKQGPNPDIYYNLGNAWYRDGDISQAILSYERALRLDPTHSDARANLAFVNQSLVDKPEDNTSLLTKAHNKVVRSMTANGWAWTAFVVFLIIVCFAAVYIFSSNITLRKAGFFGGLVLLVPAIYFIVVAHDAAKRLSDNSGAIVTAESTLLNSQPRMPKETEKSVNLSRGIKVEIIDSVSTPDDEVSPKWYKVRINGSNPAWLRATDVTRI